ncbi:unnamed protein product [Rotaria sp. Silwood2]|nr:unnamed protein product [Rotaria sp. Silwood2]
MNRLNILHRECTRIKEQGVSLTNEQLTTSFDTIVSELNKNNLLFHVATIQNIVTSILVFSRNNRKIFESNLLDHQLFCIIRDSYVNILCQWRRGQILDNSSREIFSQVSVMFADICFRATNTDVNPLKQLLIHKNLINELKEILSEIATTGKHLHDTYIEAIDYMLRAIYCLQKGRIEIQKDSLLYALLIAVVKCVCSIYFINMFKKVIRVEQLDKAQTFLLDTCTDYICWHETDQYNETCLLVRTALLRDFTTWLEDQALSFRQWSKIAIKIMGQLYITLIHGNAQDNDTYTQDIRNDYCKMIDIFFMILDLIIKSGTPNESTKALTKVLTQGLYSLTMTSDLRSYIKSKQIISLLLKVSNIEDEMTQFNVYRILASIMTEEDIKTLANPSAIANVFLTFLTKLIDDSSMIPRFHNLLRSLKILVQHDQIKENVTKQGMLPLLIRCATQTKFDSVKARQPALEILLTLTFNDEAARQLKQNSEFITNLKTILTTSTESGLKRVAESLIWKLEKEETAIAMSHSIESTIYTYDIMLSYSHSDRDLCYRIHDRLIKDSFRVWLDRDYMHGGTMIAMANAIENSEFVLICMSDAYKQSAYCQSEAHYAFERRCCLIPLVMKLNYRPDGWLGMIATGKMYIDFPKLGFDIAYDRLKNELDHCRKKRNRSTSSMKPIQHNVASTAKTTELKKLITTSKFDDHLRLVKDYPHDIDLWTKDHVQSFLINEKLDSLMPVLGNMNGRLLHETYKRCKANWEPLFQIFKSEVAADNEQKILTIETYIRFLDEIEKYIPMVPEDISQSSSPTSTVCNLI